MKVLYISGPYRSKEGNAGVMQNIMNAWKITLDVWKKGEWVPLCPHLNSFMMDGVDTDDRFLEGDLELLRRCDGILMTPGWENSEGAKAELKHAHDLGLETIYQF